MGRRRISARARTGWYICRSSCTASRPVRLIAFSLGVATIARPVLRADRYDTRGYATLAGIFTVPISLARARAHPWPPPAQRHRRLRAGPCRHRRLLRTGRHGDRRGQHENATAGCFRPRSVHLLLPAVTFRSQQRGIDRAAHPLLPDQGARRSSLECQDRRR